MVKIRRSSDYHPLEIVVKAALVLLIATGANGDAESKHNTYHVSVEKYAAPPPHIQARAFSNINTNRHLYIPPLYYSESSSPPKSHKEQLKDRIVYPHDDYMPLLYSSRLAVMNPPICRGSTYCEDTPYYPSDIVKTKLFEDKNLKKLAVVDTLDIAQRIDVADEAPLCLTSEQVIYPKTAETASGDWLFVAQSQQQNFTQGVRIERCIEESRPCRVIDGFASGYQTKCKQRYIYRQLAAITSRGITPELFRFPSSCCCSVSFKEPRRKRSTKDELENKELDTDMV